MTTPTTHPSTWNTNADGSLVCPHRDLSVCPDCAAHPDVLDATGAHFLAAGCPCGTPDDANGHHVCPDLPREEVHTSSEGLATVTIYSPSGQVLGIGHGFTLSDARAQAQDRARGGDVVEADIEDICWACDGATDEQRHTCQRYPELTAADLETLDAPLAPANLTQLVTDYLEANADDGDGPPSVWDFVLWNLYR